MNPTFNEGDILIHKDWKSLYLLSEIDYKKRLYYIVPISHEPRNIFWKDRTNEKGHAITYAEGISYFELGA